MNPFKRYREPNCNRNLPTLKKNANNVLTQF